MSNKPSKSFLNKVFQLSPNPISIIKADDATYVEVNDAFTKFFSLKRKEVIGKTPLELGFIRAEEELAFLKQFKKKGHNQAIEVKVKAGNNRVYSALFNTKLIKSNGHSYYLSIGTDISTTEFIQKAGQYDNFIQSLEAAKEIGVIFISNYEKKNPSIAYANQEAQNVLKFYSLKNILKMIHGQESIFLKMPGSIYYTRNIFCQDGSPLKIIFMRRLIDSTCMTQKLKEFDLTSRERQIALMAAYGHSNSDIAKNLCISAHTVKDHLKSVFQVIRIRKRGELFSKLLSVG